MNLQHVRELLLYTADSSGYLETAAQLSEITDRDDKKQSDNHNNQPKISKCYDNSRRRRDSLSAFHVK